MREGVSRYPDPRAINSSSGPEHLNQSSLLRRIPCTIGTWPREHRCTMGQTDHDIYIYVEYLAECTISHFSALSALQQ